MQPTMKGPLFFSYFNRTIKLNFCLITAKSFMFDLYSFSEQGRGGNGHEEGGRQERPTNDHRKRSAAGRTGGRHPVTGEATVATADVEDNQSLIEIKDSVA